MLSWLVELGILLALGGTRQEGMTGRLTGSGSVLII